MANPFAKGWKYLMALFGAKIDEYADPKIQIQQAVEDAQNQHQKLTRQAAAVLGNQRQLEMQLSRRMSEVEKLHSSARQALVLADQHRAKGDQEEAAKYEQTATAFATQLVTVEQSLSDMKTLHDQALQAAEQAKRAVEQNAYQLQQKLAERTRLLSQLEQARMQEQVAGSLRQMSELSAPGSTPSLTEVRDKIEQRYAVAMGQAELAQNSVEGRMLEVQRSTLEMAGASRLEEIRAGLSGRGAPQVAGGAAHPQLNQGGQQQPQPGQASLVKGTGNASGTGSNGAPGNSATGNSASGNTAAQPPPAPSQDGEQRH